MRVYLYILIIAAALTFCVRSAFPKNPVPIRTPIIIPVPIKPLPIPTEPIVSPTPATPEEWSHAIELKPDFQKFPTKTGVVKKGDLAVYQTERIFQDDTRAVRWVKTFRLWKRKNKDGTTTIIPLSNGWTAQAVLSEIIVKPVKVIPEVMK